jgi:hypothetical protein
VSHEPPDTYLAALLHLDRGPCVCRESAFSVLLSKDRPADVALLAREWPEADILAAIAKDDASGRTAHLAAHNPFTSGARDE